MPEDKRAIYVWMILYGSKLYVGIFIVLVGKATGVVTSVVFTFFVSFD